MNSVTIIIPLSFQAHRHPFINPLYWWFFHRYSIFEIPSRYNAPLYFKSGGEQLSGTFVVNRYVPPYEISSYCSSNDTEFLPLKCEPDSVYYDIMVIKSPEPGEPLYANYKYYAYTEEELLENGPPLNAADEVSTIQLSYQPGEPAGE